VPPQSSVASTIAASARRSAELRETSACAAAVPPRVRA
jgi:hypothetical protein